MLRNSRWSHLRWHAFRRGGCAACYHRGPHIWFLVWWGRWRRLQTALEYATRYTDPEEVGPLLLPVADAGDFAGSVLEVPIQKLWPGAMYAKESVAIKELVKGLGVPSTTGEGEPKGAGGGAGDESSDSDSTESSSESSGSSLEPTGSATTTTKRSGGGSAPGPDLGKRDGGTFVVGGKSAAGPRPRAGGPKRKRARLAPRLPSQRVGTRALNRQQSGGGCLLWAVPYVSTALYRVAQRWCWVVAPSGVVPPPGAVYVGVAPTGVRAPLIVPTRCLGGGRGPKCLARWESRQAAWQSPAGWHGSSGRAARTDATQSPSEGDASRGARRGPGLSDQLARGPPGPPNNHNGGSPADPGVPRPGGMLGPRNVCDQSPPGPVVQPDGPRPPLFSVGVGEPLFVLLLRELSGKLAWLSVALKTSVCLLMQRLHLFLMRAFVTAEDFWLPDTVTIFLRVLGEL